MKHLINTVSLMSQKLPKGLPNSTRGLPMESLSQLKENMNSVETGQWSGTVTNRNPEGNVLLYKVFSDYRRMLKSIIKVAKRSYYCNEIYI